MKRLLMKLAITATVGNALWSNPTVAQVLPPAPKAARIEITQGPELEGAREDFAIIRWTTNNPGGSDVHYGVVHYGPDPQDLRRTAKSPIRLNQGHSQTVFRVRVYDLKPETTYYYKVTSTESDGKSDGMESPVKQFTTPGPGQRVMNYPPQPVQPR